MESEYKMKQVFPVKILALEGEDLEVTITILYDGGCHDMKFQMKKTDEPGKYIDLSTKNVMNVERLPVKDYAIFLCEGQHEGKLFRIAKLMGKNPEENPEALEQFKKFTQRKGFQQESIYVPKQKDACVSENN
ncbi:odorant-binding protein 2a [Perognathus longimembris pacificus]|uniref:odorant-binding protein 2a n=1 Tax=Perognathus longimembris pacificus TaxID=214514 RepID=UPI0020187F03|nr:odorant-binding protein 2a [Perognathus longimembris pacificus]